MLSFEDFDHYANTIEELILLEAQWIDEYVESEDDVIIPDEALDAFESEFNFLSLRKFLEQEEEMFLMSRDEDWSNNPSSTHFIIDDYIRTVLNPACEIKIGNSIFKYINSYVIIEITDADIQTLNSIRENITDNPLEVFTMGYESYPNQNVVIHWSGINWTIGGSGPHINNSCWGANNDLQLIWFEENNSANDLSISFTDNVFSILPDSHLTAIGFELVISNVNGSNPQTVNFGGGYMGPYTHLFSTGGAYKVCLTQRFQANNGQECTLVDCDTVVTGACCDANANNQSTTDTYADGNRKMESWVKIVNNLFEHKLKAKTKNYSKKNNGGWKEEKADEIIAGIVGGTGGSTIFTKNSTGICNIPHYMTGLYIDQEFDEKKAFYTYSPPGINKFYVHSGTVMSGHLASDSYGGGQNDDITINLGITQDCN